MFVAILGFLGLLLLHGVETGVRAMRTRRHPDQFAGWRLRILSLTVPAAGLGLFCRPSSGFRALHIWTRHYKRRFGELPEQIAHRSTARTD